MIDLPSVTGPDDPDDPAVAAETRARLFALLVEWGQPGVGAHPMRGRSRPTRGPGA